MNADFERWVYSVKAKGIMIDGQEVPLLTGLLYRVCGGSQAKFEELTAALELAFEAGQRSGKDGTPKA